MSDLDDLEEIEALFLRDRAIDRRAKAGKLFAERCIDRNREKRAIRHKFGKDNSRRRPPPVTLAGPKS